MGKKLLVADDSLTIQKVIKLALSSEGYHILTVPEGREAIRAIKDELPDVVLIDVALPGADAFEVKKAINQISDCSAIGFILMASAFEKVDEHLVDEVGFQGRLIKPFDPSHLRKAITDILKNAATKTAPKKIPEPPAVVRTLPEAEIEIPADVPEYVPAPDSIPVAPPIDDLSPIADQHPIIEPEDGTIEIAMDEVADLSETKNPSEIELPVLEVRHNIEDEDGETQIVSDEDDFVIEPKTAAKALENDIKDLTESTIKMSGLDEWNLDDSKKMKTSAAPASVPTQSHAAKSAPQFNPPPVPAQIENTKKILRPRPSEENVLVGSRIIDDGGSSFPLHVREQKHPTIGLSATPPPPAPVVSSKVASKQNVETGQTVQSAHAQSLSHPEFNRAEMEDLLKREFQSSIEKMVREAVPGIAEKLIRQEIERILESE